MDITPGHLAARCYRQGPGVEPTKRREPRQMLDHSNNRARFPERCRGSATGKIYTLDYFFGKSPAVMRFISLCRQRNPN
jgi:hypothetical protein